jgi:hypothetical protein
MGYDFEFTEGVNETNLLGNNDKFVFSGDIENEVQIYNNI